MPPQNRPTINSINEMRCEFCLFAAERWQWGDESSTRYLACHNTWNEYYLDGIKNVKDFCDRGLWIVKDTRDSRPHPLGFEKSL